MLIIITGALGSGKTLLLTYLYTISSKKTIISNYVVVPVKNKEVLPFSDSILFKKDISDVDILLDEGYIYLESRTSSAKRNRILSYLLFQSRKRDIDIYITAQLTGTLDIRFRKMCDIWIYCERDVDGFHYTFINISGKSRFSFFMPMKFAKTIFPLYDTRQTIMEKDVEFNLRLSDPRFMREKAYEIAEKIVDEYDGKKTITKNDIRYFLLNYLEFIPKSDFVNIIHVIANKLIKE